MGTLSHRKQIAPGRTDAAPIKGAKAESKTAPTLLTERPAINKNLWREEVAGYAVQNGVSAAARQFHTTRKTVRLWMKRLNNGGPAPLPPTGKDLSAVLKETIPVETPHQENISASVKPITKERRAELLALNPSPLETGRRKRATASSQPAAARRGESCRPKGGQTRLLQIEALSLTSLAGLAAAINENPRLPDWQLTALDIDSGAAWVAFCHQPDLNSVRGFIRVLTGHWEQHGLAARNMMAVLNPRGELLRRVDNSSLPELKEIIQKKFASCRISAFRSEGGDKISAFHARMGQELYAHPETGSVRRFLDMAYAYVLRAGYERKDENGRGLPPYQILARLENGRCHESIINLRPQILDKSRRDEVPGLILCKNILTGLSGLLYQSLRTRWQKLLTARDKAVPGDKPVIVPRLKNRASAAAATGQFVSLKNISWKNTQGRPTDNNLASRNRAEVIGQAREMLARNMAEADLRATLPITEAELALIRQSMNVQNRGISR